MVQFEITRFCVVIGEVEAADAPYPCRRYLFRRTCLFVGVFVVRKIVSTGILAHGHFGSLFVSIDYTSNFSKKYSVKIDTSRVASMVDSDWQSLPCSYCAFCIFVYEQ